MKRMKKFAFAAAFTVAAGLTGVLGVALPAAASPIGNCSGPPHWNNSISAGVASCDGSNWRVNVNCLNNATVYGSWGGARSAATVHSGCKNNWFVNVWVQ